MGTGGPTAAGSRKIGAGAGRNRVGRGARRGSERRGLWPSAGRGERHPQSRGVLEFVQLRSRGERRGTMPPPRGVDRRRHPWSVAPALCRAPRAPGAPPAARARPRRLPAEPAAVARGARSERRGGQGSGHGTWQAQAPHPSLEAPEEGLDRHRRPSRIRRRCSRCAAPQALAAPGRPLAIRAGRVR